MSKRAMLLFTSLRHQTTIAIPVATIKEIQMFDGTSEFLGHPMRGANTLIGTKDDSYFAVETLDVLLARIEGEDDGILPPPPSR